MAQFRYIAVASSAERVEGMMEAASKGAVVDRLHALGQVPIHIDETGGRGLGWLGSGELLSGLVGPRRVGATALARLTSQLSTLLHAGLALDEALGILEELVETERLRQPLAALRDRIRGGSSVADAMAAQPEVFPGFYVSMVRAGEAGASLEIVLARLAEFLGRSEATREHVKSVLLYPVIVAVTCTLSIAILLGFVVPRFAPLFEQAGDALPFSARALLWISGAVQDFWWAALVAAALAALLIRRQLAEVSRRQRWERRLMRLPLFGPLLVKIEVVRFSRTLGTLLRNGVSLLTALAITRETIRNATFHAAAGALIERAKTGKGLAEPVAQSGVFPPLAVHLIRVGEESGRQDEMLLELAEIYEVETRRSVDRLLALLGPALTIGLGVVVAAVIGSILSAVFSVYDLAM